MKRIILLFNLIPYLCLHSYSQDIIADTSIAGNCSHLAKGMIEKRQFQLADSILLLCKMSYKLYAKNNSIEGVIKILGYQMNVYARLKDVDRTLMLYDIINQISTKLFGKK